MPHAKLSVARFCLLFVVGFCSASSFVPGLRAQPVIPAEPAAGALVVVTNLWQLSTLLNASPRLVADVHLEVLVCSASRAEIGVVAVTDKTCSEVLELGARSNPFVAGDRIRIAGQGCLLRRRETGIEISRVPDLVNDDTHGLRRVTGEVRLTPGLHAFQLDYFNYLGNCGLDLTCQLPGGTEESAQRFLVRPDGLVGGQSNMVAGLNATYYEGVWLDLPDYTLQQPLKTVPVTNFSLALGPAKELFGIRFKGFFSAPVAGNYVFNLASDDGSSLFINPPEIPVAVIGHEAVPAATASSLHAPMAKSEAPRWMSVEGRVVFVSKLGRGLRFELRSQPDSIWVTVADPGASDAISLLNGRIRVKGIGRAVLAPNQDLVLGEVAVVTAADISPLEEPTRAITASGTAPSPLVAVGQIQGLSKDEAARHLPVRIQGVVTSLAPASFHFMSVQDETRGIFVRLLTATEPAANVGQFCEVIGYTDAGDFAPIVVAEHVIALGKGLTPSPARPTWKELINGSMDAQWVELQGLVTAVQSNSLSLLLPEGELQIEIQAYSEPQMRTYEKDVIRVRGVLFAVWSTNRTVRVGRLLMRNAIIDVDALAPHDPFDVPLKNWSQLYEFDTRATPYQRVKVRGTAIYSDAKGVFLSDQGRGIRVSPFEPANVAMGEGVEVVGYPDIGGSAPLLREAILRKTGEKTEPQPRVLDASELMLERLDSTFVQISATLMGIHSEPDSRVLEMNARGHLFLARLPVAREPLSLRVGSQLALTGVYVGKATTWSEGTKPSGFELLLNSPAQVTVLSQPSWWTPRRLLVMVGLLLVILTLAAVWISQLQRLVEHRTRQLQHETREREAAERQRVLETERARIARDLHDDLGSSLTEISVLASKGQRLGTMEELATLFRAIVTKARGLVTALDVIVWAVDPKDNSLESVADYLGDFASEYLSHSEITCRFDIPVELPTIILDGQVRHGLLLAVKETLNNVERHAQATEVEFRMAFTEDQLEIIISDNGRGFDTTTKRKGNGLKNLPLRLSQLGGRYSIHSAIGKGTVVTIGLRLVPQAESPLGSEPA